MRYMAWLTFFKLTHPVWYRLETYFRHPKIIILPQRITYFHLQIHMLEKRWLVSRVLEYQGRSVWPQVRFLRTYFKVSCQKSLPWHFGIDGRFFSCWWTAKAFSIKFSIKEISTVYFKCRKCCFERVEKMPWECLCLNFIFGLCVSFPFYGISNYQPSHCFQFFFFDVSLKSTRDVVKKDYISTANLSDLLGERFLFFPSLK